MSVNSKMTALADEIRTLSGTAEVLGIDAMASNVKNANNEIITQTDLITQIQNVVDNLPDSGNGNSGISIETCIGEIDVVNISDLGTKLCYLDKNLIFQQINLFGSQPLIIEVVKDSIICCNYYCTNTDGNVYELWTSSGENYVFAGRVLNDFSITVLGK